MKTGVVKEFAGDYHFLSNFHTNIFEWRGSKWFCGEQAFQWAKTLFPAPGEQQRCHDLGMRLKDTGNPRTAKRYGREVPINVDDWDANKIQIMREIVHARFKTSEKDMVGSLINTGAMMLVEGNTWGDTFWGRCEGKGFNTLGAILMEERGYWLRGNFND